MCGCCRDLGERLLLDVVVSQVESVSQEQYPTIIRGR